MARPRLRDAIELVSVRVAPEDVQALAYVAKHDKLSQSDIVRYAIRTHLHQRMIALTVIGGARAA